MSIYQLGQLVDVFVNRQVEIVVSLSELQLFMREPTYEQMYIR